MRVPPHVVFPGLLAAVAALAAACGGPAETPPPAERVGPDVGNAGGRGPEDVARPDPIRRVREGPGGPGGAGYARWLEQQLASAEGTLMFADWLILPGEEADEVRFTYTLLDGNYRVLTGAYVWEVDHDAGEVGAPRHVPPRPRSAVTVDQDRGGPGA